MQTPPPLRSGHIYMKDTHCAETNEKLIFLFLRFLFFELYSILYSKFLLSLKSVHIYMKHAQCAETNEKLIFQFLRFLVFET